MFWVICMEMLWLNKERIFEENGAMVNDELKDSLIGYFVELFGSKAYVNGIVN